MKKEDWLDESEKELIGTYERGEWKPVSDQKKAAREAKEAARNYLRKNARVNIRLNETDLIRLKLKAAEEGMPYQTLIASVLHKYVTGKLGA